jgi:lipopolysaccharide transport system permease protein
VIPLAMVVAPAVDLVISFALLVVLMAWYGIAPTGNIVFLPFFVFLSLGLALALGLWLGPINVRYRDIKHTLPFVIQVWMYASPVVYPTSMIPEQWRLLYSLNPMVGVIEGFRWALLDTSAPDFQVIGIGVLVVTALLIGGIVYFRKMERFFADVI